MNEMNDKIIGNVEKELDEIEIIDTESIEEKLSFIVYGTIVCCWNWIIYAEKIELCFLKYES